MPRVVITHAVQDLERWLGGKDERAAALPGATNASMTANQWSRGLP